MKRVLLDLADLILGPFYDRDFIEPALGLAAIFAAGLAVAWAIGWAWRHGLA